MALGLALLACPRPGAAADPYRGLSLSLGQGLVALFPAAEGFVVSAAGGEVYVDLAEKDLLRPGMELQVYRPDAEMVHPVTGQSLGAYEKNLGIVRVTEVREKYSRGTLEPGGAGTVVTGGDRVRLSARRQRALLHLAGSAPGLEIGPLAQALLARGEESGRFAMLDEPAWASSLAALGVSWEAALADPAALRRLGELAAADLLLDARVVPGPPARVLLGVRSLRTGILLGELLEPWPAALATAVPGEPAVAAVPTIPMASVGAPAPKPPGTPSAATAQPTPSADGDYVARDLPGAVKALAAGNLLGEGRTEVIVSDGARLALYRWEATALAWRWDEAGRGQRRILSLDAADIDADGRVEIVVVAVDRGRVTSEIRRWRDGALRAEGSVDGVYLRTASRPDGGVAQLLGQRAGIGETLAGRVEEYRWRGGAPERVAGSALPPGAGIFGMALAPSGGGVMVYALDREGFLSGLSAAGASLWRSVRPYGGYPPPVQARELFGSFAADDVAFDAEARAFQGRLLAGTGPAGVRILVPRNSSDSPLLLVRQRSFGKGEVVVLEGTPQSLEETGRSRSFDGYVADIARTDLDGDGVGEVLLAVNRFAGPLLGDRGKLVLWRPAAAPGTGKQSP